MLMSLNEWEVRIWNPRPLRARIVDLLTLPPTCPGNTDGNLVIKGSGGTPFVSSGDVEYYEYKMDEGNWIQASG